MTTSDLLQGVSTNFATGARTATNTIKKTTNKTSTVTASATSNNTAAKMDAIVSPTLFKLVSAGYTIMNKANSALEYRALEYALYSAMTIRGTVSVMRIWKGARTPPGVDHNTWKAITWRVINWLHIKLKTNVGLRKELEVAKKQQKEHEMEEKARSDRTRRTTQVDEVPDFATPAREEPTATPEVVRKLREALKETSDQLKRSNALVKELQQSTSKPAHQSRMSTSSHNSSTPKRDALEDMGHQLRAARQEAVDAKMEAASKDEQLRLVREEADGAKAKVASLLASRGQEPQAVRAQVASLEAELEAARQETQMANVELLSVKEQLGCANEAIKTAGSGLAQVKELVGKVQEEKEEAEANAASLTMQLKASREEEEKGRADAASMEKDFHEVRLRHSKEVTALKEQAKEWEGIAAEAKEVNDQVQTALNEENDELKEKLRNEAASRETLEMEVKKLKSETDGAKATEMAVTAAKSPTPSETQKPPSAIYSDHPLDYQPRLVSVAGVTSPSTPLPTTSAPPETAVTASTPKSGYTPDHETLIKDWNTREIGLPVYLERLKALKRKSDDEGETPRPIKQLRLSGENTEIPIGNLLTPGGGPAFKFAVQEAGQDAQTEDDGDASIDLFWDSFEGDADNSGTFTYGLGDEVGAEAAALPNQDADNAETNTHGDTLVIDGDTLVIDGDTIIDESDHSNDDLYAMPSPSPNKQPPPVVSDIPDVDIPAIELTPATKRKINVDDEEGSPKPSQVPRTKEDLGGEQTLALEDMTPIAVTRKPAVILTPVMKRLFTDDDGEEPPPSSQMPPRSLQRLPRSSKASRTTVDLGDEQTPSLNEMMTENVVDASREGDETTEVRGPPQVPAENEDAAPETNPTTEESAGPNTNTTTTPNTSATNVPSTAHLAPPAPSQSQAPNTRSTRNAGKPVGSLNENVLSRISASPMKGEKETDEEGAKGRGKSPAKTRAKSPAKTAAKAPVKAPERSRVSRSPSKPKGDRS
ncbi:uncharacterized protein J4E84_008369 [Alternaria hordeiaustralica]|uniref:uncharacterized protein n=1 Tax=Alternaria hordeiaustralica TaxID=1187925 RepID=UPI0020C2B7AA|nr:uncharacterized protein J4E84_008369 [Alternaria hordeiaustralica]KAI4679341.1 hypothetical protein J4E84_008369 [Alternaria hordeiaustralica]